MKPHQERNRRVDALRELMERFDAPDLTLAEAKDLRGLLAALLEQESPQESPTRAGEGRHPMPSVKIEEWDVALRLGAFSPCGVC